MRKFVPFVAVALFAAAPVQAQTGLNCTLEANGSCPVTTTASMTMLSLLRLTLSANTAALAVPTAVTQFDTTGVVSLTSAGPTFSVRANRSWTVSVKANAASFAGGAYKNGSVVLKPITDLEYNIGGSTQYNPITTSNAQVGSGDAVSVLTPIAIGYKTTYNVAYDGPGTYTLGITYTLTTP